MKTSRKFSHNRLSAQINADQNINKNHRFRLPKIFWLVVLLIFIFGLLGWFIFGTQKFKVSNITIDGSLNEVVARELDSLRGKNIFFIFVGTTQKSLPKHQSSIRRLKIVKGFPDTLKIEIEVRKPKIIWQSGDARYYIDEEGVIFSLENSPNKIENENDLPVVVDSRNQIIQLGRKFVSRSFINFISELNEALKERIGTTVTQIVIGETTHSIEVDTDRNIKIKFNTTRSLTPQLASLAAILSQFGDKIHEYVDLRVEGKGFYK